MRSTIVSVGSTIQFTPRSRWPDPIDSCGFSSGVSMRHVRLRSAERIRLNRPVPRRLLRPRPHHLEMHLQADLQIYMVQKLASAQAHETNSPSLSYPQLLPEGNMVETDQQCYTAASDQEARRPW